MDTGNFTVTPDSISNFNAVPVSHTVNFTGIHQTDSLNDFAFQPAGVINDLRIRISPLTLFRSGFNAGYAMHYENVGTTVLNSSVVFYLNDSNYTYVSSSVNPSLVTADSIVWNSILLAPFQSGSIRVTVYVKLGISLGTQISALCLINPLTGDAAQGDNWGSWKVFTTGAVDPNDILVNEDTLTTLQLAANTYLEYVIRFQNTGNDTCFNAKILNPVDTNKLELSTFEFITSSHTSSIEWHPAECNLEYKFENILLPDSNVNEPQSHGFIRYRIKPKTNLTAGHVIGNNAAIYFDFNQPVLTNTATTLIVFPTTYATITASACSSYISPSGNYTWTTTGTYTDILVNVYGGDSIITVNLTINNSSSTINIMSCDSFVSPSGNYTWMNSGTYHDTIPNASGCDSVISIILSIVSVDTSVTFAAPSLIANAVGATYQWMYCDSTIIAGATNQSFTATANGWYAVILTQNGCTDTSSCYNVLNVGTVENNFSSGLFVLPNPATGNLVITFTLFSSQKTSLRIYDVNGKIVTTVADKILNPGEYKLMHDVSHLSNGVYQLRLQTETGIENIKLVIKR